MKLRRLCFSLGIAVSLIHVLLLCYWRDEIFGILIVFTDLDMEAFATAPAKPKTKYAIKTLGCRIPELDPFDPGIRKLLKTPRKLKCDFNRPLLAVNGSVLLYIDKDVLATDYKWRLLHYCTYEAIYRPKGESDDAFSFRKPVRFQDSVELQEGEDLLYVNCYSRLWYKLYSDYITAIIRRKTVETKCKKQQQEFRAKHKQETKGFNVIMLGVDSISRINSVRQLPKTRDFLFRQLGGIELNGHHKVGDNTFPNIIALLSGDTDSELLNGSSSTAVTYERYNFMWNNFSRAGYRTLYAEDMPALSAFNYLKKGFAKAPTHYYMRPFNRATEGGRYGLLNTRSCKQSILHSHRLLSWLAQFCAEFKADRHFAFAFLTGISHEGANSAGYADWPLLQFLKRLHATGAFQRRTMLVLYSDHGIRFGALRRTHTGHVEERLPFISIVLPEWFRQRQPHQWKNLQTNSRRLTTPFDVHATVLHALHGFDLTNVPWSRHGASLLGSALPDTRTCRDAAIQPHWCVCSEETPANTTNLAVIAAAGAALSTINALIADHRCSRLTIVAITDATLSHSTSNTETYKLTFHTQPGGAIFEATVEFIANTSYLVAPDISRTNMYRDQSKCVTDPILRKFCYCVT